MGPRVLRVEGLLYSVQDLWGVNSGITFPPVTQLYLLQVLVLLLSAECFVFSLLLTVLGPGHMLSNKM